MIKQQRVTVKPTKGKGGAVFVNEEGEEEIHLGVSVMRQIGAILEMVADCGRSLVLSYEVDEEEAE